MKKSELKSPWDNDNKHQLLRVNPNYNGRLSINKPYRQPYRIISVVDRNGYSYRAADTKQASLLILEEMLFNLGLAKVKAQLHRILHDYNNNYTADNFRDLRNFLLVRDIQE
jgi:hypothetical protein